MHGRLKVKSTAEQEEAKRKEREKKLKVYNAATSRIFQKKKANELDEELLKITGEVLAVNPDFYTFWNYRKETFIELIASKSSEELQKMYENELYFLESCLRINPKSYGTWHHRCFVLDNMSQPNWKRELDLCNQFLTYDERNFHCWDYRRFVVKRAEITPQSEFEFSMGKISSNFSNYSSWHYRSKLLPIIYPDPSQPMGVTEEAILQEYKLVQNGFFTDPDDQSNWFYHRWLMGRGEQKQKVSSLFVSRAGKYVIFSTAKAFQLKKCSITLECNGQVLEGVDWRNHLNGQNFSTTWVADNICIPAGCCSIKLLVREGDCVVSNSLELQSDEDYKTAFYQDRSSGSIFSAELSAVKNETLQEELESVQQLAELETDNKWVALTEVLIMKALDPLKYNSAIMASLDKLEALDFKRKNYYSDLRSKFIVENAIDKLVLVKEDLALQLKDQKLTRFSHPDLLPFIHDLDLSQNHLTNVHHFSYFQNLHTLTLDNNAITSCQGLENLNRLEVVSLANNSIASVTCLIPLQTCPRLKEIHLEKNPICEVPAVKDQITEILPNVDVKLSVS